MLYDAELLPLAARHGSHFELLQCCQSLTFNAFSVCEVVKHVHVPKGRKSKYSTWEKKQILYMGEKANTLHGRKSKYSIWEKKQILYMGQKANTLYGIKIFLLFRLDSVN